jgi:membrane protease YdiL (CAAX protease family)
VKVLVRMDRQTEAYLIAAVLVLAGLCVNLQKPWAVAGLIGFCVAAVLLATYSGGTGWSGVKEEFRLSWPKREDGSGNWFETFAYAALLGTLFGLAFRTVYSSTVIPVLGVFAFTAPFIGVAEELVYRGWMQNRLRGRFGPWAAIIFVVLLHTAYKCSLFLLPLSPGVNLVKLGVWTVVIGIAMGWITEATDSVLPACLLHAVFDLLAYGDLSSAPWWVW